MNQPPRNQLYTTVVQCRHLLERDLARQLEGTYGVHTDGAFEPLEGLTHLDAVGRADRQAIEAAIRHEELALSGVLSLPKGSVEGAVGAGRRELALSYADIRKRPCLERSPTQI